MIAVLLPLILLLLTEAGLRIIGYGYDLRLFVADKNDSRYLVMNPNASKRYFTNEENATIGAFESFRKHKPSDTFRIFVLGESTTLGYPYMYNASFHRWLYYRLVRTFPDRRFEIINLSLTAVNSYTVFDFAKEVINYSPDAILIYCGQNEYYGALGVGSTSRLGSNRLAIKGVLYLRSFRLIQLMSSSYLKIKKLLVGKQINIRETLMKRMSAKQKIPFGSVVYKQGVKQFRRNMNEICRLLSKHQIPVFISNLVSNERDLEPFISTKADTSGSAEYHYQIAVNACQNRNFIRARQEYLKAKDLDVLRFRSPEVFNKIIGDLSPKFPSVYLVDTRKLFQEHSPHRIIGHETILEHVHPNLLGYGLMSEAFYQSIKRHKLISRSWDHEIPFEQLRREMPITKVDSLKGTFEIHLLKKSWPFRQTDTDTVDFSSRDSFEEKLALDLFHYKLSWNDATKKQMNHYLHQGDLMNATKVAESAALQYSNDPTFLSYAGKFCMNLHENEKAMMYYLQTFRLIGDKETAQALAILYLKNDEPQKALHYMDFLSRGNHSGISFTLTQSLVKKVIDCKSRLKGNVSDVTLLNQIALDYYKIKNVDVALKYAKRALSMNAKNDTTIEMINKIKSLTVH